MRQRQPWSAEHLRHREVTNLCLPFMEDDMAVMQTFPHLGITYSEDAQAVADDVGHTAICDDAVRFTCANGLTDAAPCRDLAEIERLYAAKYGVRP